MRTSDSPESDMAPRPWTADGDQILDADGCFLAECSMSAPAYEATACLMAAAPELLEALKRTVDVLVFVAPSPVPLEALAKARSAIARADGKP